jgi:hypothetical protein
MVEYKLKNELVLKPKFQIPSYAVGSSKYDYKFIFEIFYKFS